MRERKGTAVLLGLLACGLIAAGCGSDNSDTSTAATSAETSTTEASTTESSTTASSEGATPDDVYNACVDAIAGTPAESVGQTAASRPATPSRPAPSKRTTRRGNRSQRRDRRLPAGRRPGDPGPCRPRARAAVTARPGALGGRPGRGGSARAAGVGRVLSSAARRSSPRPGRRRRTSSRGRPGGRRSPCTLSSVPMIRAPVMPNGWPRAIAPPCGVHLLQRDVALVHDRDHLGGEGLVELDHVDVARSSSRRGRAPS